MRSGIDPVGSAQALGAAQLGEHLPTRVAVGVPVEHIDAVGACLPVAAGDGPRPQSLLDAALFGPNPRTGEAAVKAAVHGDATGATQIDESGDVQRRVGAGGTGGYDDITQSLLDPCGYVVADSGAALQGPGDTNGQVEGAATLTGDVVGPPAGGALQIGEGVAQAIGLVLGQVERVSLPVELHTVPIVAFADLTQMIEAVSPNFGHRKVPGEGEPLAGAFAEEPFGVLLAQAGQLGVVQIGQIAELSPIEVVVVDAQRGVDRQSEFVAALDQRRMGVFAALHHAADVLGVMVGGGALVAAAVDIAELLQRSTRPAGRMFTHTPEQGPNLRVDERRVGELQKLVQGLWRRRIPVGGAVPVVDDAVLPGCGHGSTWREAIPADGYVSYFTRISTASIQSELTKSCPTREG